MVHKSLFDSSEVGFMKCAYFEAKFYSFIVITNACGLLLCLIKHGGLLRHKLKACSGQDVFHHLQRQGIYVECIGYHIG